MAVSPDGRSFAVAQGSSRIALLDTSTAALQSFVASPGNGCRRLVFMRDGSMLLSAGQDRHVRSWRVPSLELAHDWGEFELPVEQLLPHPTRREVLCLVSSPKSNSQLFICPLDRKSPPQAVPAAIGEAHCCQFNRQGTALIIGQHDGRVLVLDWPFGEHVKDWRAHEGAVSCICFNPAGTVLATSSHDRTIKLWGWPDVELLGTLHGHTKPVRSLSFSEDGHTLASGSVDGTVRLWSAATRQELTTLVKLEHHIHTVAFVPGWRGLMAATTSHGGDSLLSWFIDGSQWSHPVLESIPGATHQ
jgi:WD40 repeat protein